MGFFKGIELSGICVKKAAMISEGAQLAQVLRRACLEIGEVIAMGVPNELRKLLIDLISEVVDGHWPALEADGCIGRLTAIEGQLAVADYGKTLVLPPEESFEIAEAIVLGDGSGWAVDFPMWTKEEGRSDLTLSITIIKMDGRWKVEIDDLHVL